MKEKNRIRTRKIAAYVAAGTVISYIITGYGITEYRAVEMLTFGLLTKSLSFRIHSWLIYPLVISLGVHIYYSGMFSWLRKRLQR